MFNSARLRSLPRTASAGVPCSISPLPRVLPPQTSTYGDFDLCGLTRAGGSPGASKVHQKHENWRSRRTPEAWEAAEARSSPPAAAVERVRCDRRRRETFFFSRLLPPPCRTSVEQCQQLRGTSGRLRVPWRFGTNPGCTGISVASSARLARHIVNRKLSCSASACRAISTFELTGEIAPRSRELQEAL